MSHDPGPLAHRRRIIHIDMDAFFASVEQRDDPALRGRPVAVGGSRQRGVVAAASYEARAFGVRSAMASVTARRKCPGLVFVPPRFEVYKAISAQIRAICARYTALIQPLSLDEAYLDVTKAAARASATAIAQEIKTAIRAETGLTASAGVSYNKLLAKLASDHRKPDGLFVVTPRAGPDFVAALEVGRFHGIGPVTAAKMNSLGIHSGQDLRQRSLADLVARFGKAGAYYYGIARAEDERAVEPDRVRKSLGAERTFERDVTTLAQAWEEIEAVLDKVWQNYGEHNVVAHTLTLKIKFADFQTITRCQTFGTGINNIEHVAASSKNLIASIFPFRKPIRLLGLALSGLVSSTSQPSSQLTLSLGNE